MLGVLGTAIFGISPAPALFLGIGIAFLAADTIPLFWNRVAHRLLQGSIIALGAGINLPEVLKVGTHAFGVTLVSIGLTLVLGEWLGRLLRVPRHTRTLIGVGTAICGGSAIAAITGVLKPKPHETAAALGIVFVLNAVALVLFPLVGYGLHLSQTAFGWWAALAIHDTSSVVGAGLAYGKESLALATTIKLARALWIVPVAFLFAHLEKRRSHTMGESNEARPKVKFPWFILGFILAAAIRWLFPSLAEMGNGIARMGHHGLSAALFLIGAGLTPAALRKVGFTPAMLGVGLWILVAVFSLLFVWCVY